MARERFRPVFGSLAGLAPALVFLVHVGCSGDDKVIEVPQATAADFAIEFPSVAAAVATTSLSIQVFDAGSEDGSAGDGICVDLVARRRKNQDLGTPLAPTLATTPCALLAPERPVVDIPTGRRAILVVGQTGDPGVDTLIGCATTNIVPGVSPIRVSVTLISGARAIPPTECSRLSESCNGGTCS